MAGEKREYTEEEKAKHAAAVKKREARKKERQKHKKALQAPKQAPAPKRKAEGGHQTYDSTILKRARLQPLSPPYEAFLKYLPHDCTERQVSQFFDGCGRLEKAPRVLTDRATGKVIRGFVTFAEEQGLRNALQRDGGKLGGRNISVSVATTHGTMQADGTHTPAMAAEVVEAIGAQGSNDVFIDGTFGRGGHSREVLKALGPRGRLHGFDVDEEAIQAGQQLMRDDKRFVMHKAPFSQLLNHLPEADKGKVRGVLLDVGISSPQLDGGRGFRPEVDGPLDMRFDASSSSETARAYLVRATRSQLAAALEAFGGERPAHARRIADAVVLAKVSDPELSKMTTRGLAALASAAKGHREYQQMHPAKMTFQALRVAVNREFAELRDGLGAATEALQAGGSVCVLTWKHAECAVVVDFQASNSLAEPDAPFLKWWEANGSGSTANVHARQWGCVTDPARRPSDAEVRRNSRSRSAVLHVHRRERGTLLSALEAQAGVALGWAAHAKPAPAEERAGCDLWGAGAGAAAPAKPSAEPDGDAAMAPAVEKKKKKKKDKKKKKRASSSGDEASPPAPPWQGKRADE